MKSPSVITVVWLSALVQGFSARPPTELKKYGAYQEWNNLRDFKNVKENPEKSFSGTNIAKQFRLFGEERKLWKNEN